MEKPVGHMGPHPATTLVHRFLHQTVPIPCGQGQGILLLDTELEMPQMWGLRRDVRSCTLHQGISILHGSLPGGEGISPVD